MPSLNELSNLQEENCALQDKISVFYGASINAQDSKSEELDRKSVFQSKDLETLNESFSFHFHEDTSNCQDRNSVCQDRKSISEDTIPGNLENSVESKSAQAQASSYDQEMGPIYSQSQDHAFNHQESYQEAFKDEDELAQDQNAKHSSFNKASTRQTKISSPWVLKLAKTVAFCAQKVGDCRDGFDKGRKFILDDLANTHDDKGQIKLRSVFFNLAIGKCTFDKDGNLIERKSPKKEKKASYQDAKNQDFKNDDAHAQGKTCTDEQNLPEHEDSAENEDRAVNEGKRENAGRAQDSSSKACTRLKLHDLYYTEGEVFTLHLIESVAEELHKRKISDFRSYISTLPRLGEFNFRASGQYQDAIFAVSASGDRLFALMHPLELLALNEKLIFKIHKLSDLSTKDFNELVMPLISKLAEWVLTLPASQGCHDIGAGGIFIHSLRVFLVALEDLHQNLGNLVYEHKRQVVPALGLVALSHDLGKLQTDFEIFAENNKRFEVNELDSSLAKFMAQERSSYIKVKYKKNRSSRHNNLIADVRQKLMHACPQCFKGYSEVLDPIVLRSSKLNTKDLDEAFIEAQKRRKQNAEAVIDPIDILNMMRAQSDLEPLYDPTTLSAQDKEELNKIKKSLKLYGKDLDLDSVEAQYNKESLAIEILRAVLRADRQDVFTQSFARRNKAEIVSYLGVAAVQYLLEHRESINTVKGQIFVTSEGILLPRFCKMQENLEEAHSSLIYGKFGQISNAKGLCFPILWQILGIIEPYARSPLTWFKVKSNRERGSIFVFGSFLKLKVASCLEEEAFNVQVNFLPKKPPVLRAYIDKTEGDCENYHSVLHFPNLERVDLTCPITDHDLEQCESFYGESCKSILKKREDHRDAVVRAYRMKSKEVGVIISDTQIKEKLHEMGLATLDLEEKSAKLYEDDYLESDFLNEYQVGKIFEGNDLNLEQEAKEKSDDNSHAQVEEIAPMSNKMSGKADVKPKTLAANVDEGAKQSLENLNESPAQDLKESQFAQDDFENLLEQSESKSHQSSKDNSQGTSSQDLGADLAQGFEEKTSELSDTKHSPGEPQALNSYLSLNSEDLNLKDIQDKKESKLALNFDDAQNLDNEDSRDKTVSTNSIESRAGTDNTDSTGKISNLDKIGNEDNLDNAGDLKEATYLKLKVPSSSQGAGEEDLKIENQTEDTCENLVKNQTEDKALSSNKAEEHTEDDTEVNTEKAREKGLEKTLEQEDACAGNKGLQQVGESSSQKTPPTLEHKKESSGTQKARPKTKSATRSKVSTSSKSTKKPKAKNVGSKSKVNA